MSATAGKQFETDTSYKRILLVAAPIIVGQLAENIINVTDTVLVSRLGEVSLNAVGLGGLYYYTFVFIALGLGMGSQILMARRNGEQDYPAVGRLFNNSLYLFSIIAVLLFCIIYFFSPLLLKQFIADPHTYQLTLSYIQVRVFGILFICLTGIYRAFYVGVTSTAIITVITFFTCLVNYVMNRALIFGLYGFPAMGITGSATASVIAEGTGLLAYTVVTLLVKDNHKFRLFNFRKPDVALGGSILGVGFPVMLQTWVSLSSWFVFFSLIEKLGTHALAISTIIKSIYLLCMIPVWGYASSANTLVSNAIGAGRKDEVKLIARKVMTLSLLTMALLMQINFFFPYTVLSVYTHNLDIMQAAVHPLWVISSAAIILSVGHVYFNTVSGTGATVISLAIELCTLAIYISYIFWITSVPHVSLALVWCSELIYMGMIAMGSISYIASNRWKRIKI